MSNIELTDEQEEQMRQEALENVNPATKGLTDGDPAEFVNKLISNDHVPKHLLTQYWALSSPTVKLSFLTKEEKEIAMLRWESIRLGIIEALPEQAYDEDLENDLQQMEFELDGNLNRAKGANGLNERILISANTNATMAEKQIGEPISQSQGIGSSIFRQIKKWTGGSQ
jgi:hypothetical protein